MNERPRRYSRRGAIERGLVVGSSLGFAYFAGYVGGGLDAASYIADFIARRKAQLSHDGGIATDQSEPQEIIDARNARNMAASIGDFRVPMPESVLHEGGKIIHGDPNFSISVNFPPNKDDKLIDFPSLLDGSVAHLSGYKMYGHDNLQIIIETGNQVWEFEVYNSSTALKVGDKVSMGEPIFRSNLREITDVGLDGVSRIIGITVRIDGADIKERDNMIRGTWKGSKIDVLDNPLGGIMYIPVVYKLVKPGLKARANSLL